MNNEHFDMVSSGKVIEIIYHLIAASFWFSIN